MLRTHIRLSKLQNEILPDWIFAWLNQSFSSLIRLANLFHTIPSTLSTPAPMTSSASKPQAAVPQGTGGHTPERTCRW